MKRLVNSILLAVSLTAVSLIGYVLLAPIEPPIKYLGGDMLIPKQIKAGEAISVTRHYAVLRSEKIVVTRRLRKGDCTIKCSIVDLDSSELVSKSGTFMSTRDLTIPKECAPGIWYLDFQAQWQDRIGRTKVVEIPMLKIEVL